MLWWLAVRVVFVDHSTVSRWAIRVLAEHLPEVISGSARTEAKALAEKMAMQVAREGKDVPVEKL